MFVFYRATSFRLIGRQTAQIERPIVPFAHTLPCEGPASPGKLCGYTYPFASSTTQTPSVAVQNELAHRTIIRIGEILRKTSRQDKGILRARTSLCILLVGLDRPFVLGPRPRYGDQEKGAYVYGIYPLPPGRPYQCHYGRLDNVKKRNATTMRAAGSYCISDPSRVNPFHYLHHFHC